MDPLLQNMLAGSRAALARLITFFENHPSETSEISIRLEEHLGKAQIIGITGPPGAGKSTLVDQLIRHYRAQSKKVGVVAIDPSSPFSGGALLGDRIRMMSHAEDAGVFIRSLGSRGAHGGLSRATRDVVRLFDAFGMGVVIVETVGVGQTELDILEVAHTTVVVLTPESGDTIQTLKAGLLEAADIFAINKADREGANKIHQELKSMLEMGESKREEWEIPIFQIQAYKGVGIDRLTQSIDAHYQKARSSLSQSLKQEKIRLDEFQERVWETMKAELAALFASNPELQGLSEDVRKGNKSPSAASREVNAKIKITVETL